MRVLAVFLLSCAAAQPGGILYEDPKAHPCGAEGTNCSATTCCPEHFICGDVATASCAPGACCPSGGAFGLPQPQVHLPGDAGVR
jgi:hypothetical protein